MKDYKPKLSMKRASKEYAELAKIVNANNILDRSYVYYSFLMTIIFLGFAFSVFSIFTASNYIWIAIWSVAVALFSVHMGGLLHDAGHNAIFKSNNLNSFLGHIVGFITAVGFRYWKPKHSKHHAKPNEEESDPDVDIPVLSFTEKRYLEKRGLARLLRRYQAYIYLPLGMLVSFSLRIESFKHYKKILTINLLPEFMLLISSLFAWFALPFVLFGFLKAVLFLVIFNMVSGIYMFHLFAPNHKGMPIIGKDAKISFLEQQIVTSRNVKGGWLVDFIYMGLNYQIEHHLFSSCPRNKLNLLTPYVKEVCAKFNLPYSSTSMIESDRLIISELHQVATSVENTRVTALKA